MTRHLVVLGAVYQVRVRLHPREPVLWPEVQDPRPLFWRRVGGGVSLGLACGYTLPLVAWLGGPWWLSAGSVLAAVVAAALLGRQQ